MQNLFIESEKHRIRIEKLVNLMTEKNYDPNKVEHFFPALIGVEVSSEEGEIWKIKDIKSYSVTLYGRYTKPYEVIEHKVSFSSNNKKRAVYSTLNEPSKNCKKVLTIFQNEFDREFFQKKSPSIILDAVEKYFQKTSV